METWTLREAKWMRLQAKSSPEPVPNGFFRVAYDPSLKTSLFFGGESRSAEPEKDWAYPEGTWTYDGQNWTLR
jgi:hypothetical protein